MTFENTPIKTEKYAKSENNVQYGKCQQLLAKKSENIQEIVVYYI